MMTNTAPYGVMARTYLDKGWQPLPIITAGQKFPPPNKFTGRFDEPVTERQVSTWLMSYGTGDYNIAIRVNKDMIGLDVDAYGDKPGADTLAKWEAEVGSPLPRTWRSSARFDDDMVSGIRYYRLPAGVTTDGWAGGGPGIEFIRHGHRYAVVPPSRNPDAGGSPYMWLNESTGVMTQEPPAVTELTELPTAWVNHLGGIKKAQRPARTAPPPSNGGVCGVMQQAVTDAAEGMRTHVIHDACYSGVCRLYRYARWGHSGLDTALHTLRSDFVRQRVAQDKYTEDAIRAEWERFIDGAEQMVEGDEQLPGCFCLIDSDEGLMGWALEAAKTTENGEKGSEEGSEKQFEWPDLKVLDHHGPAWPGGILPGMEPWVDCVAEELQVPKGMVVLALLSGISVAVRRRLLIRVKASWTEPFNVYTMSVAAPGELKTPTLKRVMGPLTDREVNLRMAAKDKVREWHDEHKVLRKTVDHASSKIASSDNPSDKAAWRITYDDARDELIRHEMNRPLDPRLFIEDATPEAANSVMAGQRGVIAVMSSEGGFVENVLGRYSKMTNINGLLKSWDGVESMVIDRVGKQTESGDGAVVVPSPYMTIGLLVQPRVLEVMGESEDVVGKGLSARFLYCVPDSRVGDRATDPVVDWTGVWTWRQVEDDIERCLSGIDNMLPFEMDVTREAAELFKDARVGWERDRRADGRLAPVVDWSNKLASHVVRVAGAIALLRIVCVRTGPWMITDDDMRRALAFGEWQVEHAVCAYQVMGTFSGTRGSRLRALVSVLKEAVAEGKDRITHADLRLKLRSRFTSEEVWDVARDAEKLGWLVVQPSESGNFKHNTYVVNPNVVSL